MVHANQPNTQNFQPINPAEVAAEGISRDPEQQKNRTKNPWPYIIVLFATLCWWLFNPSKTENLATPEQLQQLTEAFRQNQSVLTDLIATSQKQIGEDDASLLITIVQNPGLILQIETLSKILGIYGRLPEGSLREMLRKLICEAIPRLDICNTTKAFDLFKESTRSTELGKSLREFQVINEEIKKACDLFTEKKISIEIFEQREKDLRNRVSVAQKNFRLFLKSEFPELPEEIYASDGVRFKNNWISTVKKWIGEKKGFEKFKKTLEEYKKVDEQIIEMRKLIKQQ